MMPRSTGRFNRKSATACDLALRLARERLPYIST
jgi:hypothetical protein